MSLRFLVTLLLIFLGALYLLLHNPGSVEMVFFAGRTSQVPVVVLIAVSALLGAIGAGLSEFPDRAVRGIRRWRDKRREKRLRVAEEHYRAGVAAMGQENLHKAGRAFRRALRKNPSHPKALLESGNLERRQGNLAGAFEFHRKALQTGERDNALLQSLADDLAGADRPDALRALWDRTRRAGLEERIPLERLRDYYIGREEWETAANVQAQLLCLPGEGKTEGGRKLMAYLLYESGRRAAAAGQYDHSLDSFSAALSNDNASVPPRVEMGDAYRASGEFHKALRVWQEGFAQSPASVFIHRVMALLASTENGAAQDALKTLRKMARKHPEDARIRLSLAKAYLLWNKPDDAIAELDQLAPPFRRSNAFLLLQCRALLMLQHPSEALEKLAETEGPFEDFVCSHCGHLAGRWSGRCPSCGQWDTLDAIPASRGGEITPPDSNGSPADRPIPSM